VRLSILAVLFALLTASAASATTVSFSFNCIAGDGGGECAIPLDQLSLEVTDLGGGEVSFTITNNDGEPSFVAGVYFEDEADVLDELASVLDGSGVDFQEGGSPPDLPSGTVEGFDADWAVTARPPSHSNGARPGESVTIVFELESGVSFDDLIDAMESGELRVGVHAPAFDNRGNKSFLASAEAVVPEPSALAMLLAGLGAFALRRR
jgi:hypothetical protein